MVKLPYPLSLFVTIFLVVPALAEQLGFSLWHLFVCLFASQRDMTKKIWVTKWYLDLEEDEH